MGVASAGEHLTAIREMVIASDKSPLILLDDSLNHEGRSLVFSNPVDVIECTDTEDIDAALVAIDQARANGLYAAGFLSYELGYLLEPKLRQLIHNDRRSPLIWMGLFHEPQRLGFHETLRFVEALADGEHTVENLRLTLAKETYLQAVDRVKAYISAGDVYQINLTFKYLFEFTGNPWSLYASLRQRQRVAHGAFIQTHDFDVLSLSPELFVRVDDGVAGGLGMERNSGLVVDSAELVGLGGTDEMVGDVIVITLHRYK